MTRVLVVDDSAQNRYMLRALLQGHGFEVEEARHGAEALTKARQAPPDIVVSDLLMPVLDGYTLLRQWRADEHLRSIPFIVYTATYTEPRDEQLALSLGADAFIVKPAEPEQLLARIRQVLADGGGGIARPPAPGGPVERAALLDQYSTILFRKLEEKVLQLEQANRQLLEEIAERKRTEAALRESDDRFRATFEQAAVGIAHVSVDGVFLRVNDRLCEITGYSREELQQRTFMDLTVPEDRAASDAARVAMLSGARSVFSSEKRYVRGTGKQVWISLVASLLRDEKGAPSYFIAVFTDITDRKVLEEQLRQSQKLEAIGQLAGGVAHDFNNLLTVISGYSELILALPDLPDPVHEFADAIREAGERAGALTRQLLGFSRQTILQPRVLDLNQAIIEATRLLRRLIGEDIALTTVLASDLSRVKVDPNQLDQVLMNLAVNARDAMPRGGRLVLRTANVMLDEKHAAVAAGCGAGPHVLLAMTDTGHGMTPQVMAHIFDPFFTTKEVGKGSGLGLSMVLGIVEQSEGCILVQSEPGQGSTFTIYLPAVDAALPIFGNAGPGRGVGGAETILLVEDEEGVRQLATMSLRQHGYRVLPAADGNEALKITQEPGVVPDLLLTDVVMPGLSGPDLARRLQERFPRLEVLFMSGYTDDAVVRHGLLDASVSFIQKPYTPVELARKVRDVLSERKAPVS
jgi:PAS domain S-box-containing protein